MAMFNRPEVTNIVVTPTFTHAGQWQLQAEPPATGKIATTFTKSWARHLNIDATPQIIWGMKKLELALALDNTGSMASSNKMTELKKAAQELLTTLKNAAKKAGDVKVAIIPFDTTVNIGTSYKNNFWFDIVCPRLQWPECWPRLQQQQLEGLLGGLRPRPDLSV